MSDLKDKVIIVTGAFGVLGASVAQAAAQAGAKVALVDLAADAPDGLQTQLGDEALFLGGVDLTNADTTAAAFKSAQEQLGGLDGLVNVAGGFLWETLEGGSLESWNQMYEMNVRTAVTATASAVPLLRQSGSGRIINVSAAASAKAAGGMGPYAASKAGVSRFTESLAEELKDTSITVNAIAPTIIDTPRNRTDMPGADFTAWVTPQAAADVILFLLSDKSQPITGATIPLAGRT